MFQPPWDDRRDQADIARLLQQDARDQADARSVMDQKDHADISALLAPSPFRDRTVHFARGADGRIATANVIESDGRRRTLRLARDRQGELAGIAPQEGPRLPQPSFIGQVNGR